MKNSRRLFCSMSENLTTATAGLLLIGAASLAVPGPTRAEVAYSTEFPALEEEGLAKTLNDNSELRALEKRPPETLALLRRRARSDMLRLREVLRAEGYYAGIVDFELVPPVKSGGRAIVQIVIEPGPPFTLENVTLRYAGPSPEAVSITYRELGLERGAVARAAEILEAEGHLLSRLAEQGHPYAGVLERQVVVDHSTQTVLLILDVSAGPRTYFGPLRIEGLDGISPRVVQREIRWREGAPFDSRMVRATRDALTATGLFASLSVQRAEQPDSAGVALMRIRVQEAAPRSIGAGARYETNQGFGVRLFWRHRNFLGGGERFDSEIEVAQTRRVVTAGLSFPGFIRNDQTARLGASAEEEDVDAFDATRFGLSASLERSFSRILSGTAGVSFERSIVEDDIGVKEGFDLIGLPLSMSRDSSNDVLDPTAGGRLQLAATPYVSVVRMNGTAAAFS